MNNPWANFHLYNQYRRSYLELKNREKKDHVRKLIIIKDIEKYEVADKCDSVCVYPSDYDGEDCMIIPCFNDEWVMDWIRGYPRRERIGFEIKCKDPTVVYIMYSNIKEYRYLIKKYDEYIDGVQT